MADAAAQSRGVEGSAALDGMELVGCICYFDIACVKNAHSKHSEGGEERAGAA